MSVWIRKSCNQIDCSATEVIFSRDISAQRLIQNQLPQHKPSHTSVRNIDVAEMIVYNSCPQSIKTDCKLGKAYDEMRDSYLQLKEQYSNLFKENQRLKDAGHTYEGTHA